MTQQIYINLPVRDLPASLAFYQGLGYRVNPQFSNEQAACIVISHEIMVMLLTYSFFAGFSPLPIADAKASTQMLLCLSCESREAVDELVKKALAAGGKTYKEPQDHGCMYSHGFQDPDGYIWELSHMDMSRMPAAA